MCLILTVRLAESDALRTAEIVVPSRFPIPARKWLRFSVSHQPLGVIQIPGPEGGCGCSFLTDSADWSAPTWDMIPATLPRLSNILRGIRAQAANPFSFEALWVGESATEERQ